MHRRALFGGALALTVAPVVQPAAKMPQPDAELLNLGKQFAAVYADEKAAWVLANNEHEDDGPYTKRASALSEQCAEIANRIQPLRATTIGGLAVKVQAVEWHQAGQGLTAEALSFWDPPNPDMVILAGLLQDIAAIAGAAA